MTLITEGKTMEDGSKVPLALRNFCSSCPIATSLCEVASCVWLWQKTAQRQRRKLLLFSLRLLFQDSLELVHKNHSDCIQVSATTVKKGSQNYQGLENLTVVRQMSFCFSSLYTHSHLHHSQTSTITDPVITVFVPLVSERKFDRVTCKFLYIPVNSHIYQN